MTKEQILRLGDLVIFTYNNKILNATEDKRRNKDVIARCSNYDEANDKSDRVYYIPRFLDGNLQIQKGDMYKDSTVYYLAHTQEAAIYKSISNEINSSWEDFYEKYGENLHVELKKYLTKENGDLHTMGSSQAMNFFLHPNECKDFIENPKDNPWPRYVCNCLVFLISHYDLPYPKWDEGELSKVTNSESVKLYFFKNLSILFNSIYLKVKHKLVVERTQNIAAYRIVLIHDELGETIAENIKEWHKNTYAGFTAIYPYNSSEGQLPQVSELEGCLGICVLLTEKLHNHSKLPSPYSGKPFIDYLESLASEYGELPVVCIDAEGIELPIMMAYEERYGLVHPGNIEASEVLVNVYKRAIVRTKDTIITNRPLEPDLDRRKKERKYWILCLLGLMLLVSIAVYSAWPKKENIKNKALRNNELPQLLDDKDIDKVGGLKLTKFSPFYPCIIDTLVIVPNKHREGSTKPISFYNSKTGNEILAWTKSAAKLGYKSFSNVIQVPKTQSILLVPDRNEGPILAKLDQANHLITVVDTFSIDPKILGVNAKGDAVDISRDGKKAVVTFYQSNYVAILGINGNKATVINTINLGQKNKELSPSGVSFIYNTDKSNEPKGFLVALNNNEIGLEKIFYISIDGKKRHRLPYTKEDKYFTDIKTFGDRFIATTDRMGKVVIGSTLNVESWSDSKVGSDLDLSPEVEIYYPSGGTPCDVSISPGNDYCAIIHQQHPRLDIIKLERINDNIKIISSYDFTDSAQTNKRKNYLSYYARGVVIDWDDSDGDNKLRVFITDDEGGRLFSFEIDDPR